MRESRLSLHEKIPSRHNLQVVKTQIHNQRACEDTNFLRDGWATGRRARKEIVYYIIEEEPAPSIERICVALFDFDLNLTSAVIYRQGVLGRALPCPDIM